jgi:hypothetical protein
MYTNKFKGSTNLSTTIVLAVLVAAIHLAGYEMLNVDAKPASTSTVETDTTKNQTNAVRTAEIEQIVVVASRLK